MRQTPQIDTHIQDFTEERAGRRINSHSCLNFTQSGVFPTKRKASGIFGFVANIFIPNYNCRRFISQVHGRVSQQTNGLQHRVATLGLPASLQSMKYTWNSSVPPTNEKVKGNLQLGGRAPRGPGKANVIHLSCTITSKMQSKTSYYPPSLLQIKKKRDQLPRLKNQTDVPPNKDINLGWFYLPVKSDHSTSLSSTFTLPITEIATVASWS